MRAVTAVLSGALGMAAYVLSCGQSLPALAPGAATFGVGVAAVTCWFCWWIQGAPNDASIALIQRAQQDLRAMQDTAEWHGLVLVKPTDPAKAGQPAFVYKKSATPGAAPIEPV